ncbi:MAG: hypothetical protein NTY53_26520 [Kiritimatiellaeota bacterium]|nr:hypothetical protein [Kiritimatiellota bacterium]
MKLMAGIAAVLKSYVYVYSDPRNGRPFYIGKGKGDRLFAHLDDTSGTEKTVAISAIRKAGREPQIDILRYGLTDAEAALVEAAAIDLIGLPRLANQIAGHHESSFGRIGSREIIAMLSAKPVRVRHKAILITINRLYRSDMTAEELYEATRGVWAVGPRREKAEYGMAVYQGIVREIYRIHKWHRAGTLAYHTRDYHDFRSSGRWEFEGVVATDIRDEYIGNSVGMSGQNPIRYKNI